MRAGLYALVVEQVDVDVQQPGPGRIQLLERAPAQVDDAAGDVWTAIGHLGINRATGNRVLDAHERAARQTLVGDLDGVGVEDLAARGAIALKAIAFAVGRREACLEHGRPGRRSSRRLGRWDRA